MHEDNAMHNKWTRERILHEILDRESLGLPLTLGEQGVSQALYQAGSRIFGSWRNAIQAAGIPPEQANCGDKWSPAKVLGMIRHLARSPHTPSVKQLERRHGSLVSASRRHFGSWSKAVIAAGVNPAKFQRVVPWTPERIIEAILTRALRNESIVARSVQPRSLVEAGHKFFGNWMAAVKAAGLDANFASVSRVPSPPEVAGPDTVHKPGQPWTNQRIVAAIHARLRLQKPMNSYALYKQDRGLHHAAKRHYGNWRNALLAAGLNPEDHRRIPGRKGGMRMSVIPNETAQKSQAIAVVRPEHSA
jgi:hypothetical protein